MIAIRSLVSSADGGVFTVLARGPWPRERVTVLAAPAFAVAREHEPIVERAWRGALDAATASGRRLFPGAVRGLAFFSQDDAAAASTLRLALHATDYRAFVGTNLCAEYLATGAPCSDALGISVAIEVADPEPTVLLHRRGAGCFEWPLAIDTPGGHVEPGAGPFEAALDELESELGLRAADVTALDLLGLARMEGTRKPQAVLRARVRLTVAEISSRLDQARERFETDALLPFTLAQLDALTRSKEPITPACRAALTLFSI